VTALFAEDGSFIPDEGPTATGSEQIRRTFEGAFRARSFQRELHVDQIREGSDMAVAQTHTTGTITILAANDTIQLVSRELFVLRRTGADWPITDDMFNRPAGAAAQTAGPA
jgi:ketosteroid isomerase-like protein